MYKKILAVIFLVATLAVAVNAKDANTRSFEIEYSFKITDIPPDSKALDVWVPIPSDTEYQKITDIKIDNGDDYTIKAEGAYGNKIAHTKVAPNGKSDFDVKVSYKVERVELIGKDAKAVGDKGNMEIYLKANRLVTLSDHIKAISADVTKGKDGTMEKARAIYDYVFDKMSYDKSGKGWGRGDTEYACDVAKGNCTDFHSLFISLARAAGIPAKFKIGFMLPTDKDADTIGGYHCWAEFYDDERGWVPVDASEAKKAPEKKEYFFSNVCENRVELTVGRDLTLNPAQSGEKLNFFVYPYIEVDGNVHSSYEKTFSFKNI